MANLSIREAVKHYQVSRPTLTKALKFGKISGTQDGQGKWSIDPSELARIYQPRLTEEGASKLVQSGQPAGSLTTRGTVDSSEIEDLRAELAKAELRAVKAETRADAADILAKERADRIEDLRRMLPAPDQLNKRRWWQRGQ